MRTLMREKKIYCGTEYLEVDIFPYTKPEKKREPKGERSKKTVDSTLQQVNWNDRNSRRRCLQLIHANFGPEDLHVSLTYSNQYRPPTIEAMEREERNFLRRVAYARKKKGLPPLKYLSIPSCKVKQDGITPARPHHHIIINGGLSRDEIEDLWRKRRRKGQKKGDKIGFANADRLQPDENGLAALCHYLAKQSGGKKRWSSSHGLDPPKKEVTDQNDPIPEDNPQATSENISRVSTSANLERPWSRTNNHRYSRKEIQKIATNPPDPAYWEKRYPGYTLMGEGYGYKAVYSESRGWALYLKLRRPPP